MERPHHLRLLHYRDERITPKLQHLVNPWAKGDEGSRRRWSHRKAQVVQSSEIVLPPKGKKGKRRKWADWLVKFLSHTDSKCYKNLTSTLPKHTSVPEPPAFLWDHSNFLCGFGYPGPSQMLWKKKWKHSRSAFFFIPFFFWVVGTGHSQHFPRDKVTSKACIS